MNQAMNADRMNGAAQGQVREFLSFRTGGEEYGIEILKVQEIRGFESPTRIANALPYLLGVVNLRGAIVPIIDMRLKLGNAGVTYDQNTVTIVLNIGARVVGLVVDSVSDVVALAPEQIKPAPDMGQAASPLHVIGIAHLVQTGSERMVILVDIDRLVQDPGA